MPDYDLIGLSSRSFEHMIQALAFNIIGPGIVVFGDGPDGGREATFTGKLSDFPSSGKSWDGYVVVQAKFCQRPKGKPREDSKWAQNQLRKELQAFTISDKNRKKPQYYIFVTNVVLSAANRTGGKDSIFGLLEGYKKKIGIKDYHIWDYDQICRFLDSNESVRNAYGAWITPGDVLAKFAAKIDAKTPDFSRVMINFLQKEILDDHFSKLEQAGHSPENRIRLEEVFIDLPAFGERRPAPPDEKGDLPPGFLAEMLLLGSTCLRPEDPIGLGSKRNLEQPTIKKGESGRFVLVGGPGQGKSTLAQFLCQIQRANLLRDKRRLDTDAKEAVSSIEAHCTSQQLPLEIARRFPLRLELARFAKALAAREETEVTSVLSYVAYLLKDRTDYEVAVDDLRDWLEAYPWLVVLDGLDEVPASSNRSEVLAAVRNFLVDISTCNGDVLVLTTTRPQGYNEEFSPQRYQHRWLAPLSIPRALSYGQTLVDLTYAHNANRKKEVMSRLKNAAAIPATGRLMESPLQVTIMARLLAQVAKPPQERYRLFQQYYKVIYQREMERGVEILSQLLRDHEANVDSIHHRTGLLLQMESEKTRHTDATITVDEFKAVVTARLREEGFSGEDLESLADAITTCATDRLVFLVPSQSERVGFEIRSLQEFMAAEALMDASDDLVVERLREIAPVPFWQNVLLFAAGKCFAERQWLRDSISQVCGELNDDPGDNLAHLTMAGSRMAVNLLEDGPARRQPAYAQVLARRALSLLALPPEAIHERLADVFERSFERVYREELSQRLQGGEVPQGLAAWLVITKLADRGVAWAQKIGKLHWPKTPSEVSELLTNLSIEFPMSHWAMERYSEMFFDVPMCIHRTMYRGDKEVFQFFESNRLATHAMRLATAWSKRGSKRFKSFHVPFMGSLEFTVTTLAESREALSPFLDIESFHEYWKPLKEGARFANEPTIGNLAEALGAIAEVTDPDPFGQFWMRSLPWPISACLTAAHSMEQIQALASRALKGKMGEPADWINAEARWVSKGISKGDLAHMTDERWPIPKDIGKIGFPFGCCGLVWQVSAKAKKLDDLTTFWRNLPGTMAKSFFARIIIHEFDRVLLSDVNKQTKASELITQLVWDIISSLDDFNFLPLDIVFFVFSIAKDSTDAQKILDHLGKALFKSYPSSVYFLHGRYNVEDIQRELVEFLTLEIERRPTCDGIVNLLAFLAASYQIQRVPDCLGELILSKSPRASTAAVVLQLAQRGMESDAMQRIAQDVLEKCARDEESILQALEIFDKHQMDNPAALVFLEKLLMELPASSTKARIKVVHALMELLGQRVASLSDRHVWENLHLPSGLFDLLRSQQ